MLKNVMSRKKKKIKSLNSPRTPAIMVTIGLKTDKILSISSVLVIDMIKFNVITSLESKLYGEWL